MNSTDAKGPLERLIGEKVVLDTGSPIVYIGVLIEMDPAVFVLEEADMHDCREGHANKEVYLAEASTDGVPVNRRRVVVMRSSVISVSRVADIVTG